MSRFLVAGAIVAFLGACELQSQDNFDAQPFEVETIIPRNYQAAYADVVKGSRKCWGAGPRLMGLPSALELETNLYSDLKYGEVYSYASGTVFMPQALVRIEDAAGSAKIMVKTGPQAGKEKLFRQPPIRWARGDISCS